MATKKETVEVAAQATEKKKTTRKPAAKSAAKRVSSKKAAAKAESTIKIIDIDQFEVKTIAQAMLDKKAKNVCSLDLREVGTSICDYFVVCNVD